MLPASSTASASMARMVTTTTTATATAATTLVDNLARSDSTPFATVVSPSEQQQELQGQQDSNPAPSEPIPLSSLLIILVSALVGLALCACLIYRLYIKEGRRRRQRPAAHHPSQANDDGNELQDTADETTSQRNKRLDDEESSRPTDLQDWPLPATRTQQHLQRGLQHGLQEDARRCARDGRGPEDSGGLHAYSSREELLMMDGQRQRAQHGQDGGHQGHQGKDRGFFFMPW